jgi:hypothetical protein
MVAFLISPHFSSVLSSIYLLISTMNALSMYIVCVHVSSPEKSNQKT